MNNQVLENYLTIPVDNEEYQEQVLRIFVTEGPQIVVPILHMMLPNLKGWGVMLPGMKEWEETLTMSPQGRNSVEAAMKVRLAENMVDYICNQALLAVARIATSSPQRGKMVGEQMLLAMADRDADIRTLAAIFSTAEGIPSSVISSTIIHLFLHDQDPLVKMGAALAIARVPGIPDRVFEASRDLVMGFLINFAFQAFPEVVRKTRLDSRYPNEGTQNILIATRSVFRMIAVRPS